MPASASPTAIQTPPFPQYDRVRISLDNRILTLTLDDPETRNALDFQLGRQFLEVLRMAAFNADVGAVIVTGGSGVFCSGGNFKAFGKRDDGDPLEACSDQPQWKDIEIKTMRYRMGADASKLLHEMPKPTIALMTGPAVGAGVGLAAACDFRVVSPNASFTPGYLRIGLSPDVGTSYFITQILGSPKAKQYFLLKDKVTATEAIEMGLADFLEEDSDAATRKAHEIAARLAGGPPIAIQYTKEAVNNAEYRSLSELIDIEARNFARCFQTDDQKEAVKAFIEKRKPLFKGL